MAQHDMVLDNGPGLAVRTDMNAAIQALVTNNSGATEPTVTYAGQFWLDTTVAPNGQLKIRNQGNSGWVSPLFGEPLRFASADMAMLSRTGGSGPRIAFNDKVDGTGADVFSVGETGALITAGSVTATGGFTSGSGQYMSTAAQLILGANVSTIYLRPNGAASAVGQATFATNGNVNVAGTFLTQAAGIGTFNDTTFGMYRVAPSRIIGWLPTYYMGLNESTGRMTLIMNGVTGCYWEITGAFLNNGPAYKPGGGPWLDSSDARIKTVLGDYEPGLAEVRQLHPVAYTFKGNDTPEDPEADKNTSAPYAGSPHFRAASDGSQFVGLIAQEVEPVFPAMVTQRTAWIDGAEVSDMRDLDTNNLIYALVNAIKELATRVETLEGAPA